MKNTLIALAAFSTLTLSLTAFAGTTQVEVRGIENGNPIVTGVRPISNANPACIYGTLIGATDEVENALKSLVKKDKITISASQLSRECIYLVRSLVR